MKSVSVMGIGMLILLTPFNMTGSGSNLVTSPVQNIVSVSVPTVKKTVEATSEALVMYDSLQLKKVGLSKQAFEYAWKGYTNLKRQGMLIKDVLSICDFTQSSRRKRLYIIDLEKMKLVLNTFVAHGRNSGSEYARTFSNSHESHKSSLGFYITESTYYGGHGLALKIKGVEKGFNDQADERNIVVHGSDYVGSNFIRHNKFNGRSFGCPAVPAKQTSTVINTIKEGSCLFIYHPTKKYISQSKILNG